MILSVVYGDNQMSTRELLWEELRAICQNNLLENNIRITAKLFKLNFQEERNFSIWIEAYTVLSLRVDHAPLKQYLGAAG